MDRTNAEPENVDANLFDRRDRERVRNYFSFVVGSIRRHTLLVAAIFVSIVGATVGLVSAMPKTYHVEAKALFQTNAALTVRGDGPGAESLTHVAGETVLRHDNLLSLIQQTDLVQYTRDHRAPIERARDIIAKVLLRHEDSETEQTDALVRLLEKKFSVWTSESGSTVTVAIDWPDAPMACRLVDAAQKAFLDARYAREITALAESIGILGSHTAGLKADIDGAVGGIESMRGGQSAPKADAVAPAPTPRVLSAPVVPRVSEANGDLEQLRAQIHTQLHAIDDLDESRRRRLSELQAQLAEARTTYTENYPAIVDLKQLIAAVSVESPQVASLRAETAALKADYDRRTASASEASAAAGPPSPMLASPSMVMTPPQIPSDVLRLALDLREDRDPGMVYAREQLRDAMDKYAALRTQIQTAQIDLETAQAAFKYRYSVITPARLPKGPASPNVPLILIAAIIAALLSAVILAVVVDVRADRLVDRWQVENLLDRPILGEVELPSW
jgi:uncharacterized protein involved in exopolysaccharide biosynthesis